MLCQNKSTGIRRESISTLIKDLPAGFSKRKVYLIIAFQWVFSKSSSSAYDSFSSSQTICSLCMVSIYWGSQGPGMKCVSGLLRSTITYRCVFNWGSFHKRPFLQPLVKAWKFKASFFQDNFFLTSTVLFREDTVVQNSSNWGQILEYKHLNNNGGYFPEAVWLQQFCYKVTLWVMLAEPLTES